MNCNALPLKFRPVNFFWKKYQNFFGIFEFKKKKKTMNKKVLELRFTSQYQISEP